MKKIVSFSLDPATIRKMDRLSKALGMSRSEFVEQVFGTVKMSEAKLKRIEAMQRELADNAPRDA